MFSLQALGILPGASPIFLSVPDSLSPQSVRSAPLMIMIMMIIVIAMIIVIIDIMFTCRDPGQGWQGRYICKVLEVTLSIDDTVSFISKPSGRHR